MCSSFELKALMAGILPVLFIVVSSTYNSPWPVSDTQYLLNE